MTDEQCVAIMAVMLLMVDDEYEEDEAIGVAARMFNKVAVMPRKTIEEQAVLRREGG